jgi:hypothetical protein
MGKFEDMVELCIRAGIKMRMKPHDANQLIEDCRRHKKRLVKNMCKLTCEIANIHNFDTGVLRRQIDVALASVDRIDRIITLLQRVDSLERKTTVDIRTFVSAESTPQQIHNQRGGGGASSSSSSYHRVQSTIQHRSDSDLDSTIIEEFGS